VVLPNGSSGITMYLLGKLCKLRQRPIYGNLDRDCGDARVVIDDYFGNTIGLNCSEAEPVFVDSFESGFNVKIKEIMENLGGISHLARVSLCHWVDALHVDALHVPCLNPLNTKIARTGLK
jgi:hypothetical protein